MDVLTVARWFCVIKKKMSRFRHECAHSCEMGLFVKRDVDEMVCRVSRTVRSVYIFRDGLQCFFHVAPR